MKSMGIDGVVNTVHYGELFEFFRQCMEFNFRPDFLYTTGADVAEFLELFGAKAIEGVCVKGIWDPNWKTYGNKEFCEAYKKKWGEDANHYSSIAPAGQVMQQAIEKAGSLDREGVKKVLEQGEFESQLYPVKYVNEHGYTNINKLAFIGAQQWQAGKLLFVYPDLVAQAKFAYPMRWEK
jgi:branched-chain amino acid transport system substrate-binding protein